MEKYIVPRGVNMETTPAILRPFGGDVLSPTDNVPGRPAAAPARGSQR